MATMDSDRFNEWRGWLTGPERAKFDPAWHTAVRSDKVEIVVNEGQKIVGKMIRREFARTKSAANKKPR
jgi:hypothetical protein